MYRIYITSIYFFSSSHVQKYDICLVSSYSKLIEIRLANKRANK